MSNDSIDLDDDDYDAYADEYESSGMKNLRQQAKKQAKELKALQAELASAQAALRERTVTDAITAKGLNPKIAKFIPTSIAPDAIDAWLQENGDVFGAAPAAPADNTIPQPTGLSATDVAALGAIEAAGAGGVTANSVGDLEARIAAASTPAELDALIRSLG